MQRTSLLTGIAVFALLSACGDADDRAASPDTPETPVSGNGGETSPGQEPRQPIAGFDRERARTEAEALLGLAEPELQTGRDVRIVRRGEERFPVTMDLRPGRKNLELDDDGTGRYVVTRVVVETPEGSFSVE